MRQRSCQADLETVKKGYEQGPFQAIRASVELKWANDAFDWAGFERVSPGAEVPSLEDALRRAKDARR